MVLKRIFPTKDKEEDRHKQAIAKMIFLAIVGLSILAAYILVDTSSNASPETTQPKSLGEETIARAEEQDKALAKNISEGVDTVKDTAEFLQLEIESTTQNAVQEGKKQVEDAANELLYSKALKPIVDKIEDLPPAQQEQLRKQICPIVDTE